MLNRIIIMGRLTRDPELRRTQNGTAVTSFTLAVDRDFKDKATGEKETEFIDVVAWRSTAEFVCNYFAKGRMAVAEGRLQIREWTDKEGNSRRTAEVVADNLYFGESRRDGAPSKDYAPPPYGAPVQSGGGYGGGYGGTSDFGSTGGFAELDDQDGELPF